MKKMALTLAGLALSAQVLSDPTLCLDSAGSCGISGFDANDMDAIFLDVAGDNVNTIVGSPQLEPGKTLYDVIFESPELLDHGSGFAIIYADDGWINELSFYVDDLVLSEGSLGMEVAEFSLNARSNTANALVEIAFERSDGTTGTFGDQAMAPGENPFTVWTNDELERITLTSDAGFEVASFKHLRVDVDTVTQATAPSHIALLSLGLLGLYVQRKKMS